MCALLLCAILLQLVITNAYGSEKDPDPDAPGNVGGGLGGSSFGGAIAIGNSFASHDPCASGCQEVRVTGYRQPHPSTRFYLPQNVIWANVGSIQIAQANFIAAAPVKSQSQQKQECERSGGSWIGADAAMGLELLSRYNSGIAPLTSPSATPAHSGGGFCRASISQNACRLIAVAAGKYFSDTRACTRNRVAGVGCAVVWAATEIASCEQQPFMGRGVVNAGVYL